MKKIVHLLNSKSFLPWIKASFDDDRFENKFILLNLNKKYVDTFEEETRIISIDDSGKNKLLSEVNAADIVIHYFLDYTKSELILNSKKSVKHYWYFFGADVYQQLNIFRNNLYQKETKRWLRFNWSYRFRLELRAFKYRVLQNKPSPKRMLINSIDRIEKVLWYVDDEIELINTKLKLPEFTYYKFFQSKDVIPFEKGNVNVKSNRILIGNSAALENNHLDVLSLFKKMDVNEANVALPLVYGEPQNYKAEVIRRFKHHFNNHAEVLEEKKSLKDYYEWLNDFPTAIMLHNRQQGLGNIFYLLANGTKLYLSEANIIYTWLKKNNIHVSSFEKSFEIDYRNNQIILNEEDRERNLNNLRTLLDKESVFKEQLLA